MEEDLDIRSDKTVVLGLCGPIGSGCTTLSKFIANESYDEIKNGIKSYLSEKGYSIDRKTNRINVDNIDQKICEKFDEMYRVESISDEDNKSHNLYKNLKSLLEIREYTYELRQLFDPNFYKQSLRISMSSLIVFDLIRFSDSRVENSQNKDLQRIISAVIKESSIDVSFYKSMYDSLRYYFSLEKILDKSSIDLQEKIKKDVSNLQRCFLEIKKLKAKLTENELYRFNMQNFGDNIRSTGNPYIFLNPENLKNTSFKTKFQFQSYNLARYVDYIINFHQIAKSGIRLFVIDSFRNPMCVKYLRRRYPRFYLISLYADKEVRLDRLEQYRKRYSQNFNKKVFVKQFEDNDKRDQGAEIKYDYENFYKQNVQETSIISDIALNNNLEKKSVLFNKILRYLALIFMPGCTKPNNDETFMNMAYTMAMKSNCISRKVGAVIAGKDGYLVGAGWNDVGTGQISCGLRNIKDLSHKYNERIIKILNKSLNFDEDSDKTIFDYLEDNFGDSTRCFCFKDLMSKIYLQNKIDDIVKNDSSKKLTNDAVDIIKQNISVKRLEFCKALHAEENAILQGAKTGGIGVKGGAIYVTTYPCELCAKKIQQSEINKVVYVEPYPGSISKEMYLEDGIEKVESVQFEGVKAYAYFDLFKSFYNQKERQALLSDKYYFNIT